MEKSSKADTLGMVILEFRDQHFMNSFSCQLMNTSTKTNGSIVGFSLQKGAEQR